MMIIAGHQFARIVMVGYNGIGNLARARPFGSTTDHILPLNMPYAFVKSLPAGAMRLKIQALLPFDGTETILTKTFKERIFNEACNLMLIPGWMNEALGNILRPHHSRPATKLDGPSAKLLSDYMSKVKKFYLITAATAAKAMAEAAQDPQVQQAFMEYCQSEFNRVFNYVSQTSGWTGPALVPYKIEGGRPKLVTGQGRGLREIDLGAANATELANAAVNATLPVDPYTLNSTTLDALKVENNTVSDPVTPPASQPTIAAAPPTASNSDGSIDIPPPQSSPPPPLSTTNTTAVAPPIAASNSSDGTIQINPSSPLDQKLTKPYSAPIDQNIEEYQDA
ncbi:MAG: hypothetical protein M1832_000734 [Thelocarpon impressellum]|nr:MAG: hypothetical protein M1832_000734 [Thelocarpon impressellum]